jgi:hypothetical protein
MIKFINSTTLKLNGLVYKGYTIGNLPTLFAFKYDEENDKEGIAEWFNYKGLTWIAE